MFCGEVPVGVPHCPSGLGVGFFFKNERAPGEYFEYAARVMHRHMRASDRWRATGWVWRRQTRCFSHVGESEYLSSSDKRHSRALSDKTMSSSPACSLI